MNKILKISLASLITIGMCMCFAACGNGENSSQSSSGSSDSSGGNSSSASETAYYTVTFDANGGTYSDGTTVQATTDASGKAALPSADPSRDDYTFSGYNTTADGTGSSVTASYVYTADTTVYAMWTENQSSDGDGGDGQTTTTTYYFDAEYTDLTDLSGDLGSGTSYNKEMITTGDLAHEGYYVANFNIADSVITYTINAAAATTADMSLILTLESENTIDSDLLKISVNETAVSYDAVKVTPEKQAVSAIKSNIVFQEIEIGEINLVEGENTITLTVGTKANASGTGTYKLTFHMDAMVLESETTLTWNPITDWDSFYPDF